MSACHVGTRGQRLAKARGIQHRADATCLHIACAWQRLGKWCGMGERAVADVAHDARIHTAVTGHETMIDTVTRRTYRRGDA